MAGLLTRLTSPSVQLFQNTVPSICASTTLLPGNAPTLKANVSPRCHAGSVKQPRARIYAVCAFLDVEHFAYRPAKLSMSGHQRRRQTNKAPFYRLDPQEKARPLLSGEAAALIAVQLGVSPTTRYVSGSPRSIKQPWTPATWSKDLLFFL